MEASEAAPEVQVCASCGNVLQSVPHGCSCSMLVVAKTPLGRVMPVAGEGEEEGENRVSARDRLGIFLLVNGAEALFPLCANVLIGNIALLSETSLADTRHAKIERKG